MILQCQDLAELQLNSPTQVPHNPPTVRKPGTLTVSTYKTKNGISDLQGAVVSGDTAGVSFLVAQQLNPHSSLGSPHGKMSAPHRQQKPQSQQCDGSNCGPQFLTSSCVLPFAILLCIHPL